MPGPNPRDLKHELRTPLNHIIGYSALLLDSAQDAGDVPFARHCTTMQAFGSDLNKTIDALLGQQEAALSAEEVNNLKTETEALLEGISTLLAQITESPQYARYSNDIEKVCSAVERLARIIS